MTTQTPEDRQRDLELEMRSLGTQKFRKAIEEAKRRETETETPYGATLLAKLILPVAARIRDHLKEVADSGLTGASISTGTKALRLLKCEEESSSEVVAHITTRIILNGISSERGLLSLAGALGSALEEQARWQALEDGDPAKYRLIVNRARKVRAPGRLLDQVFSSTARPWESWSEDARQSIGGDLLSRFIEGSGLIKLGRDIRGENDSPYFIEAAPELIELIEKRNERDEVSHPQHLPMIIPPRDWSSVWGGGYISDAVPLIPLVKTRSRTYLDELNQIPMPEVYSAINGIQRTAWQVNSKVLAIAQDLWGRGVSVAALPSKVPEANPSKPVSGASDALQRAWKKEKHEVQRREKKRKSLVIQTVQVLRIAEKFKEEPSIYFPCKLDWRGRTYYIPASLHYQGSDLAKGLLQFSEGKPLKTQEAADWLAIHGANTYGVDKVSFEDRIQWVKDHERQILSCAANPLLETFWHRADKGEKAWQFLAFCFEWQGRISQGLDWPSKIPISLDGSCNGIQHFSAMLRDEKGGAAVNLSPADVPSDLYAQVASKVQENLRLEPSTEGSAWLAVGIDRDLTKNPTMTRPYGATHFAFMKAVKKHVKKNELSDKLDINFMARQISKAIQQTATKAEEAMEWLQAVSKIGASARQDSEGQHIQWVSPIGLPILQEYKKTIPKKKPLIILGKLRQLSRQEDTEEVDSGRHATATAPNFIHSMDASAMMATVNLALAEGITAFAMVHDSYATHAADTETLTRVLREAFVQQYEQHDVLRHFRASVALTCNLPIADLPEPPARGSLDLGLVRQSKYFFA